MLMYTVRYDLSAIKLVDIPIAQFLFHFQTYRATEFFLGVTEFGSISGILTIAAGTLFFIRRQKHNMLELIVLLSGIALSVQLAKMFITRMRPESLIWLVRLTSYSFPSGHSASSVALYGFIGLLAHREMKKGWKRNTAVAICVLLILLIAFSRLILNAHYFSDVVGGLLLGTFWLLFIRRLGTR